MDKFLIQSVPNKKEIPIPTEQKNESIEIPEQTLEETLQKDLNISDIFQKLDAMNPAEQNAIFQGILEKQKSEILDKNEKFLKNLHSLADGGTYKTEDKNGNDDDYFAKKRKKFLVLLSEAYFFSNIEKKPYRKFREYTSLLGKLKDKKKWIADKHDELIEKNPKMMGIISGLEAGSVENLENKYQKTLKEIQELMEITEEDFDEHDFHEMRKKIRFVSFVIGILSKKLQLPEYKKMAKKYIEISDRLALIREVEGTGNLSWKTAMENTLHDVNNISDLEQLSGPSQDFEGEDTESE